MISFLLTTGIIFCADQGFDLEKQYKRDCAAYAKFFRYDESVLSVPAAQQLQQFRQDYASKQPSTIDLTGLKGRERVVLMLAVLKEKLKNAL